jgi:hypothetical protein
MRHVVEAYSMEICHRVRIVPCMFLICPGVTTSSDPGLTRFSLINLPIIIAIRLLSMLAFVSSPSFCVWAIHVHNPSRYLFGPLSLIH